MAQEQPQHVFYSDDRYEIRPARSLNEFREIWWDFMQGLGWNRSYYDLDSSIGPSKSSGMILLIDKINGRPVGHVAAVVHANEVGWISLFVIDEAHRGKGMGRELFQAAMTDARQHGCKLIGLDGVLEQKATYERRDFVESRLGTIKIMSRALLARDPFGELADNSGHGYIIDIRNVPQKLLAQHELRYTGFDRHELWTDKHMFDRQDVCGSALVTRLKPECIDDILSWTLARRCSSGFRIGPLYAHDADSAKAVLQATMKTLTPDAIKNSPIPRESLSDGSTDEICGVATLVAEVWGGNQGAVRLFQSLGWTAAGVEYHRMWVNDECTVEQDRGGMAQQGAFAMFDATSG